MAADRSIHDGWRRLAPRPARAPEEAPSDPPPSTPEASPPTSTFVASGAVFEGSLSLTGDFHLDTEYRGTLVTDGIISIGPNGSVVGDIRAREVLIQGAVVGDVLAPRQLVIESTGRLHGDIETACLEIQRHAFFKGNTTMTQPQASRRPVAPSESSEPNARPLHA